MPDVSIIIPVHNRIELLRQTLRALLHAALERSDALVASELRKSLDPGSVGAISSALDELHAAKNRWTEVDEANWPARSIFRATMRLTLTCRARYTTPMPPRVISSSSS